MSHSTRIPAAELLLLMRHFLDVVALKHDPPAQRQLLIDGLNRIVGTDSSFFYVADEWRPGKRPHFAHYTLTTQHDPLFLRYTSEFGIKFPLEDDPYCSHSIRAAAPVQVWTSTDVLPDLSAARQHPNFMDLRSSGRLRDGIVSFYRTGPGGDPRGDRIVGVGMHRFGKSTKLSPRQLDLVRFAIEEIRRMVQQGHLVLPPVDALPQLPPRLGQILDRLLAGQSPKQIARELGLSLWTIREHIHRLYQQLNVTGREELMARFIH